jgi:hypothetical protein
MFATPPTTSAKTIVSNLLPHAQAALSTAAATLASAPLNVSLHHERRLASEKEAKHYIRKIRHETLRVSVIQRLEEYLDINQPELPFIANPKVNGGATTGNSDDEDDDGEGTRRPSSPEPLALGMWHDQCKQLFLWYYNIYLVPLPLHPPQG